MVHLGQGTRNKDNTNAQRATKKICTEGPGQRWWDSCPEVFCFLNLKFCG